MNLILRIIFPKCFDRNIYLFIHYLSCPPPPFFLKKRNPAGPDTRLHRIQTYTLACIIIHLYQINYLIQLDYIHLYLI